MDSKLVERVGNSFRNGKSIRRNLPLKGKLVVDQKLPYLCVYRFKEEPDQYISSLLKTQGAYLIVHESLEISTLLERIMEVAMDEFKSFMIAEIWNDESPESQSTFRLLYPEGKVSAVISTLEKGFGELSHVLPRIKVKPEASLQRRPEGFSPLINLDKVRKSGVLLIGIAVPPLFRDKNNVHRYPLFFRRVRAKFGEIIRRGAFELVRGQTESKFVHYQMLGKTRMDNLVRSADKRIAAIDEKMNFILSVTPVNVAPEWEEFKKNEFSKVPKFRYRLISIDPELEKRKLFNIPLEEIEHSTLAFLLRDKRMELEKQLLMLEERGTRKFFHTSQSIYGDVDEDTIRAAKSLLNVEMPGEQSEYGIINAVDFAQIADKELEKYRKAFPRLHLRVKVKDSVSGLLVSGPELSVGKDLSISSARVNALIQHEIGTHILTYCNGHAQPLHLMYSGFAGYEQLQEGIAVLAEFLVGGLNVNRLRLIAARVLAVNALIHGADFMECFRMLKKDHGFGDKNSFNISMRVFRGGGYTKDAIYLKGLIQVLNYIKNGGDLEQLYAGKFALEHLPLIEELEHLNILKRPVLPDYLRSEEAKEKINRIKKGINLNELIT